MKNFVCICLVTLCMVSCASYLCPSPPRSQTTFQVVVPGEVPQPRTAQDGFVYPKGLESR